MCSSRKTANGEICGIIFQNIFILAGHKTYSCGYLIICIWYRFDRDMKFHATETAIVHRHTLNGSLLITALIYMLPIKTYLIIHTHTRVHNNKMQVINRNCLELFTARTFLTSGIYLLQHMRFFYCNKNFQSSLRKIYMKKTLDLAHAGDQWTSDLLCSDVKSLCSA